MGNRNGHVHGWGFGCLSGEVAGGVVNWWGVKWQQHYRLYGYLLGLDSQSYAFHLNVFRDLRCGENAADLLARKTIFDSGKMLIFYGLPDSDVVSG